MGKWERKKFYWTYIIAALLFPFAIIIYYCMFSELDRPVKEEGLKGLFRRCFNAHECEFEDTPSSQGRFSNFHSCKNKDCSMVEPRRRDDAIRVMKRVLRNERCLCSGRCNRSTNFDYSGGWY